LPEIHETVFKRFIETLEGGKAGFSVNDSLPVELLDLL
jgi:hypothetical protein